MELTVIAQVASDVGQLGGWASAGLLGAVLSWLLLVHLPAKDKQIKELIDNSNARVDKLISEHVEREAANRTDFRESLDLVIAHCESENKSLREMLRGQGK